jgi:putative transposase
VSQERKGAFTQAIRKGRKRHILTDTLDLLICVVVHSGGVQDRDGACRLLQKAKDCLLKIVFADEGYKGKLVDFVKQTYGWLLKL